MTEHTQLQQKRILLAEDVKLNQYIAQRILESWGCQVIIANDGREALSLLQQNPIDCVLMDVQMPELDGMAATEIIRKMADPAKAAVPIIALTANALIADVKKYIKVGMNDCIAKPIDEAKLFAVISKSLSQKDGQPAAQPEIVEAQRTLPVEEKMYDLTMVIAVSGGDKTFIRKMIALFIETVPQNVSELRKSFESENWDQVAKIAHKLKSTIDSMGIKSVQQDIRSIEMNAKQKVNLDSMLLFIEKIETVIARCVQQLYIEAA